MMARHLLFVTTHVCNEWARVSDCRAHGNRRRKQDLINIPIERPGLGVVTEMCIVTTITNDTGGVCQNVTCPKSDLNGQCCLCVFLFV